LSILKKKKKKIKKIEYPSPPGGED